MTWSWFDPLVAVVFLGVVPAALVVQTAAHFLQIAACCFQFVACCCCPGACHIAVVQTVADYSTVDVAREAIGPGTPLILASASLSNSAGHDRLVDAAFGIAAWVFLHCNEDVSH